MNAFFQFIKGENYTVVRFYLHPISSIKSIKKTPPPTFIGFHLSNGSSLLRCPGYHSAWHI